MKNIFLILLGKLITLVSQSFNLGSGSTWPGHIALKINKNFTKEILQHSPTKIVLIAGTNGKTTTSRMLTTILEENHKSVFQNAAGANLLNGIASSLITNASINGKVTKDYGVFEVDENVLPLLLKELIPHAVILLNLFRDQLDRYGEIDSIIKKWKTALQTLTAFTLLILNADDPQIAFLSRHCEERSNPVETNTNYKQRDCFTSPELVRKNVYFGLIDKKLNKKELEHASDSMYCPNCHTKLTYQTIYYSHLGIWHCSSCKLKRPQPDVTSAYYPLAGTYNKYNTLAAVALAKNENLTDEQITKALTTVTPAFGRQEILQVENKKVQIFLSKNPASFNQSLETIANLQAKTLLLVLNDRIPDGRDVSWIWDVDFEKYNFDNIIVSGDRVWDLALRLEYTEEIQNSKIKIQSLYPKGTSFWEAANSKVKSFEDLNEALKISLQVTKPNETLFILPTYSAMLEVRKILTGKKIL